VHLLENDFSGGMGKEKNGPLSISSRIDFAEADRAYRLQLRGKEESLGSKREGGRRTLRPTLPGLGQGLRARDELLWPRQHARETKTLREKMPREFRTL